MIKYLLNNKEWLFSGCALTIIGFIVFLIKIVKKNTTYFWKPSKSLKNENETRNINSYGKNPKFNFEAGEFYPNQIVSGEESFLLMIQKFILTDRYKYPIYDDNYGIEETRTIFQIKSTNEFARQCGNIANHLMNFFSEWIQEIYAIYRKNNKLIIEMKVKGKPETLKCVIPNIYKK